MFGSDTVQEQHGMVCPACGDDEAIRVTIEVECVLYPDGALIAQPDQMEWTPASGCRCECGFTGKVADFEEAAS